MLYSGAEDEETIPNWLERGSSSLTPPAGKGFPRDWQQILLLSAEKSEVLIYTVRPLVTCVL